jgi:hypothetical protein
MRGLLESVANLAKKHGWFVFFRRLPNSGNLLRDKAEMKVFFQAVLDNFFDGQEVDNNDKH